MVAAVLAMALSVQQVQIDASVDRKQVLLGEEFILTVRVTATGKEAVQLIDPLLTGIALRGTSDRSEVSIRSGTPTRVRTRELRLSAIRAGKATIGSVRARMGDSVVSTEPIEITVAAVKSTGAELLDPRIRNLVESHDPDSLPVDEAYVEVITSSDSIVLGEQFDLVVVAWLPRPIRSRLRNPPLLNQPELSGAWTYSEGGGRAVALGRRVRNTWYDLYVSYQAVFPLTTGRFAIGPAKVSYSLPLSFSFLSRERRHEVSSDSVFVDVTGQPLESRPPQFDGAAGADLEFSIDSIPSELRVGEAGRVVATVSGRGNVSLWPEPRFRWPSGLRVYPENVEVDLIPTDSAAGIAGSKRFKYLVVADSAGVMRVGQPTYEYFDLATADYVTLRSQPLKILITGPVRAPQLLGRDALLTTSRWAGVARMRMSIPLWVWLIVGLIPPLTVYLVRFGPRIRMSRSRAVVEKVGTLPRVGAEFNATLERLVRGAEVRDRVYLADALRAAGVDEHVAMHAARVRDRLWQVQYGPAGELDPEELVAEMREVIRALVGASGGNGTVGLALASLLILIVALAPSSQAQSAEKLFETGALQNAADSFARRIAAEPWSAAHQYNLGFVMRRLGADAEAEAAWVRAARLEPRRKAVRRALRDLPRGDMASRKLMWISPVTPSEAIVGAAVLWILGWLLVGLRVEQPAVAILALAVIGVGYGTYVEWRYGQSLALTVPALVPLREAPYGPAPSHRSLERSSAVKVLDIKGVWIFVEHGSGRGWVMRSELTPI
ncbi:MAG: BatD family protein [Gemmatimonadales bacterium]